MTNEEAKTKWCPFARCQVLITARDGTDVRATGSCNRDIKDNPMGRCCADACACWVNEGRTHSEDYVTPGIRVLPSIDNGHCGLVRQQ
jgi:hypothetical protein